MAQPSILQYFNCRKRPALDDFKVDKPAKHLKLNEELPKVAPEKRHFIDRNCNNESVIQLEQVVEQAVPVNTNAVQENATTLNSNISKITRGNPALLDGKVNNEESPTPVPDKNCTESQKETKEMNKIKNTLRKSAKLAQLKQSLEKFKKSSEKLEAVEKRNEQIVQSLKLKTFSSIEVEVPVSPKKIQSPKKFHSPEKQPASEPKSSLQLPFKYRTLNEIFRAVDTIVQIMYNRQEIITFKKLKPAVEELVKRNFQKTHLAQIKFIYPSAYDFAQQKIKTFGTRQEEWDLILRPTIQTQTMTTVDLLHRRRKFLCVMIDRVKNYHSEFLSSLTPPLIIPKDDLTSWHPEFAIEKVPDIEFAHLPQTPNVDVHTSGRQVLECARRLFTSNVRMNQVPNLEAVREKQDQAPTIKGIPEALLKKVREKQASKALMSMTKSVEKEKEMQVYSRLPEIARFVRNLFVTERKSVLPIDVVLEKLMNSYRTFLNKNDMEHHLKVISTEIPGWLIFHKVRNCVFIKVDKQADLSGVINKLEKLAAQKKEI